MLDVVLALVPALAAALYFFGWNALRLVATCTVACVVTEAVCRKLMGRDNTIGDWSAVVTGILLAFNLPPALPSWMAVVGSVFAIVVAKQVFGGLGYNPFNPALAARVALLVSFPVPMTRWHTALHPQRWSALAWTDATTSASPLPTSHTMRCPLSDRAQKALPALTAPRLWAVTSSQVQALKPSCIV